MVNLKKAISVGTSAALLASLLATVAAPTVLGAATDLTFTVTGAGSVPVTGTSGAVSIAVGEGTNLDNWAATGNTLTFTLTDAAGAAGTVAWSGTPAISGAPGSLGTFTVTKAANVLTVVFTTSNTAQTENFTISGMTIDTTAAAVGGIRVTVAKTAGGGPGTIPAGTGTASGVLTADEAGGQTAIGITCDTGSFPFVATDASNGNLVFAAPDSETRAISAVDDACVGGDVTATVLALTSFHAADTVVTQSVSVAGLLTGIATVAATITETAVATTAAVQPGENNQVLTGASVVATESNAGTLAKNSVVTFTLDTAGVLFSAAPTATPAGASLALNSAGAGVAVPCSLSFDRTSCSVTVTTKSTAAGSITLTAMSLDLASTVAQGTKIGVNITTSPSVPINVVSKTIATVSRILVGVAAQPTIYINENDQSTGQISLTESAAGLLTAAATNNYFGLCISTSETFTRAPFAVVTAGNLLLRSGAVGATSVQGTLFAVGGASCVEWVVYSKSTTASTIEIRGSDAAGAVLASGANNGPRLSVPNNLTPGATQMRVLNGSQANVEANAAAALVTTVSNALRAFRNQPVVAAVSQPIIPAGSARAQMGDLTISETSAGQFKAGEVISVTLQQNYGPAGNLIPVVFRTGIQADYPIATTNTASGLIASVTALSPTTVTITITQQASGSLGVITLGNLWVYSLAAAPSGPVLVRVTSAVAGTTIDQTVSNATIGVLPVVAISASNALGVPPNTGAYSTTTKIQSRGKYVTWRFSGGSALAGKTVEIWVATKSASGAWGSFTLLTKRVADGGGNAWFWWRSSSATWISVRAKLPASATNADSWSPARQARWL